MSRSEELQRGEVIIALPKELVNEIKDILLQQQAVKSMLDHLIIQHEQALRRGQNFWQRIYKEYLIEPGVNVYIDFATEELKKA